MIMIISGTSMGNISQGWSTTPRGWWEQGKTNRRHFLVGLRFPQSRSRNIVWTHFGSKLFRYKGKRVIESLKIYWQCWRLLTNKIFVWNEKYVSFQGLLDVTCKTVANMIKGKTPEEIRKTFNIKNDFTPSEEEQVRKENEWCEEKWFPFSCIHVTVLWIHVVLSLKISNTNVLLLHY